MRATDIGRAWFWGEVCTAHNPVGRFVVGFSGRENVTKLDRQQVDHLRFDTAHPTRIPGDAQDLIRPRVFAQ